MKELMNRIEAMERDNEIINEIAKDVRKVLGIDLGNEDYDMLIDEASENLYLDNIYNTSNTHVPYDLVIEEVRRQRFLNL